MAYIPKGNMVFFLYYVVGLDEEYLEMMNFKIFKILPLPLNFGVNNSLKNT
jgi:hypothetical protein